MIAPMLRPLFVCLAGLSSVFAQVIDNSPTRVQTTLDPALPHIGTLVPRNAREIETSRWTLGCETLDREYASYDSYKEYLPHLGIRRIRLQGGWARTEKDPGLYDFAWLDHAIDDARSRGLEIWLETGYGNPAYPGGGGRTLADGFPTSAEGLAAWDRWVEAMALRYKGKVRDWAMWNEPSLKKMTKEQITDFNIRTAEIVKRIIPEARIAGLILSSVRLDVIEHFMKTLVEQNKLGLFEWVVYHAYVPNPDTSYAVVQKAWAVIRKYSPTMKLWQGEAGIQSEWCVSGAVSKLPWTELTQAKWDTRRMLGDLGNDVDSTVFTAADLDYRTTPFHNGLVRYGLIKTAGAAEGYRVLKVKMAFYAVQNVVSVFNDAVERTPDTEMAAEGAKPLALYRYRFKASGRPLFVFWDKSAPPSDRNDTTSATFRIPGAQFTDPVWVDTITGNVHQIPASKIVRDGNTTVFKDLPVYDAPTFVAEKADLAFVEPARLVYERTKKR